MKKAAIDYARLEEVKNAVTRIWYSYAEGFLPLVTGSKNDDKLYEIVDSWMPSGWTVSVQSSGSVYASRPMLKKNSMTVLVIQKEADGYQRTLEVVL